MRIKIYVPAFINHEQIDRNGWLEVPEGSTLKDVYKQLKVPPALRPILLCSVNYEKARLNKELKEGDVVSVFFPISGG